MAASVTHAGRDSLPAPVLQNTPRPTRWRKATFGLSSTLSNCWATLVKHLSVAPEPTATSVIASTTDNPRPPPQEKTEDDTQEVDEVIVDRAWSDEMRTSDACSEHVASPEKPISQHASHNVPTDEGEGSHESNNVWASCWVWVLLRYRLWPAMVQFFSSRFVGGETEEQYAKENWFVRKPLAVWSSIFFLIVWLLGCIFVPRPLNILDKIFHYGVAPALVIPLLFFVMWDFPRDRPILYQMYTCTTTYSWAFYLTLNMYLCGYYGTHIYFLCGAKDFNAIMFYTAAIPTIALFGLKLNRFPAMVGSIVYFVVSCALIIPARFTWARNMINFAVYIIFLLYMHYMRENAERRLYTLREQLKVQFKAAQKAQVNERKAAESKRRLTSYVFHDKSPPSPTKSMLSNINGTAQVRVPLNTALLAVENMEASGIVAKSQEIEFKALEGSLIMMSKVLNDVLDFNRMDSGRFESVSKPYSFHQVMRSLFIPLTLATRARHLQLVTDLDPCIDQIARRAMLSAAGESPEAIEEALVEQPFAAGIVVGDETRLRQIVTNLASNACKFTPAGGKLAVSTRLVLPQGQHEDALVCNAAPLECLSPSGDGESSTVNFDKHVLHKEGNPSLDWIVVRIEVTDTGCGIRRKDLVDSHLFSPFNQTERGRQQGGKGTGLGLALVRQIVALSGGRLGLRSKAKEGSTFWVELPLGVGQRAITISESQALSQEASDSLEAALSPNYNERESPFSSGVGVRNSPSTSTSAKFSSAMHSLMEQGGRFELSLSRHESQTPLPTRTISDILQAGYPPLSDTIYPARTLSEEETQNGPERPSLEERTSTDKTQLPGPSRPKLAALPSHSSNGSSVQHQTSSASLEADNSTRGIRVLVVDDDPWTRVLMLRMLTRMGCEVTTAENGELALDLILGLAYGTPSSEASSSSVPILERATAPEGSRFDVIFLDNQMPVLSGLEAVARLREMGRRDFIVGVTGNALLSDQEEYLTAGADCVLTKPVRERSLKGMLALAGERSKRK